MSLLKKASLLRRQTGIEKPSKVDRDEKSGFDARPTKGRSVSEFSRASSASASVDEEGGKVKRKSTFGAKGRKRLSSLFSSSSLSSYTSDREASASPRRGPSNLNISTSTSGSSTPTQNGGSHVATSRYSGLAGKGAPPDPEALTNGVRSLRLGTEELPVSTSPENVSPISTTRPGRPIQPTKTAPTARPRHSRTPSLYSQWDEDGVESSDDEDMDFLTPSEGLSEVEEGDEEDEAPKGLPSGKTAMSNGNGDAATKEDVCGTGLCTIHRHKITAGATKVIKREASARNALAVDQAAILAEDLDTVREVLALFLTSHMKEAEEMCEAKNPEGNRMYLQSAHGIIQGLKGMMTFDSVDLANALEICRGTAVTASALRRPNDGIFTRVGGLVRAGAGVARVKAMTPLERHAELVYAETSLMKAILAIVSGGDWLGLVKEALNMRTAHGIYRTLQLYLEEADSHGYDDDIDMDFRSGVLLGTGTSSLMLSLLPGKVLKIAEVFGYAGDRAVALRTLLSVGGWTKASDKPAHGPENEGVRQPVVDMILLTFYLVISVLMPVSNLDIPMARKILRYNMSRYPDGIFFLYFQARLHIAQCEPELATKSLQHALDLPLEYVQLQHMCLWDYACCNLVLGNWKGALDCFALLKTESNWSRAVYTYAAAASLIELIEDGHAGASVDEADAMMKEIPKLTKKIAGKSLPIEKLVSRKARKFASQGEHLFLPGLELAYVFGILGTAPRRTLMGTVLPRIDKHLAKLEQSTPEAYGNGEEYWDDYALGHFLRGVVQTVARYQPADAAQSARVLEPGGPSDEELDHAAEKDFLAVLRHGPDVLLDHWIIYHCHFELGRLYARRGDEANARTNFEVVMSGKLLEVNHHEKKAQGKYSLEGALLLKTHAALSGLKDGKGA